MSSAKDWVKSRFDPDPAAPLTFHCVLTSVALLRLSCDLSTWLTRVSSVWISSFASGLRSRCVEGKGEERDELPVLLTMLIPCNTTCILLREL